MVSGVQLEKRDAENWLVAVAAGDVALYIYLVRRQEVGRPLMSV